jgi:hypothetical protein
MSITADAVHFETCGGHLEIVNSLFEGQGDDGLNVHGHFGAIASFNGAAAAAAAAAAQGGRW